MNRETHAVADAGGKDAKAFSVWIERQHRGTIGLASPTCAERVFVIPRCRSCWRASHALRVIARGTNRYQHPLIVLGEGDIPGRVSVAMRQLRNSDFGLSRCFDVALVVRKANDIVGVGDVNPSGIVTVWEKRNSEGPVETAYINLACRRSWVSVRRSQDTNSSGPGFRDENVTVWRHLHLTRSAQSLGEQFHSKSGGDLRHH
jgi:hypothetical protein